MARFHSRLIWYLLLILVLKRVSSSPGGPSPTFCSEVFDHFHRCIGFLTGLKPYPAYACCVGISQLNEQARRVQNGPKAICQCIEDVSYVTKSLYIASHIHELSARCQVHRSFPISIAMDCSK
ncbi:hypothetical protein CDL15_Pgr023395 [Punica granatum]|uniref:Bifunctional inhibitor/plant lipid transfer protein/seed storage helical domain-containing protein n=1 Tax=Punica granatum TaxID=22663 RepID=A0A218Y3C8_PUNGR|nr:hypothetical protein CDL15_Pgr023395 [Punica granatum]PKI51330.1 hypothetical protein CRG98_028277 [Punica granatum]